MADTKASDKKIVVPKHLNKKTIWTVPPKDIKQDVPGRFIVDQCTQEELAYLEGKGLLK